VKKIWEGFKLYVRKLQDVKEQFDEMGGKQLQRCSAPEVCVIFLRNSRTDADDSVLWSTWEMRVSGSAVLATKHATVPNHAKSEIGKKVAIVPPVNPFVNPALVCSPFQSRPIYYLTWL
jgi:hypothetical protein